MINLVGQQLGNYRLIQHLGRGGFADVYLGVHHYLNTEAAIKVMHTQMSQSDLRDFLKEAQMIAALKHPRIVRILEFGEENNVPYLVMDYASQGTLRQCHPKGSVLSITTILPYVKQVATALQYAHDHKLIHQDVKPENMLVESNGEILLSDFGIAVIAHSTSSLKTQRPSGTPLYMAPEQWDGKSRPASDQYALGTVVYEWLSGKCPFQGNIHALPHQHKSVAPPPFNTNLQISSSIEDVVQRALSKDPEQRFSSIEAFAVALEQASQSVLSPFVITPTPPALQQPASPHSRAKPIRQPPTQMADMLALYQEGVKAREWGDFAQAVLLWQEILRRDPGFQNGTFTPQMIELLRQRALQAGHTGEWEEAVTTWRALLGLEHHDPQAEENLAVAEHNQKYAWMYQNAQHFVNNGDLSAAKNLLAEVWRNAPQYGDPEGLAKRVGLQGEIKRNQRLVFIKETGVFYSSPIFGIFFLPCLLSGLGAATGLLTQLWPLAIGIVATIAIFVYIFVYHRAITPITMTIQVIVSVFVAFSITWYASTLLYQQAQVSHLWLIGDRTLWLGEQIKFGLAVGALSVLFLLLLLESTKLSEAQSIIWASIWLIVTWIIAAVIGSLFKWGFGFGFGWQFSLGGVLIGLVTMLGLVLLVVDYLSVIGVIRHS